MIIECMKEIYVVEDHETIRDGVVRYLELSGYKARGLGTVAEERAAIAHSKPDLIIQDVMLPDGDGFEFVKELREGKSGIPVIFMTARSDEEDRIKGFELGADDYISKPFMPQELLLRVYAVLRRTYKEDSPLVVLDGCTIDFSRAEVNKGGKIIPLTAKEHTLLETLAHNEGKIVTVDALCEALWGDNPFGYENSLNAHVRRVREKIEADPSKPVSLITIKGLGYKLITRK